MAGIVAAALLVAASLVVMTTAQRKHAANLHASIRNVHHAEAMEVSLLTHDRSRSPIVRADLEGNVRTSLARARFIALTPEEVELVDRTREATDRYFEAPSEERLERSFSLLEQLVALNLGQADAAAAASERWDRLANVVAVVQATLIILVAGALLMWLRRAALDPVLSLSSALRAFAAGDLRARAPEAGPDEFRTIARHVNSMGEALERQRTNQLTFLSGVSHDLRTPVNTIRLSLEGVALPSGQAGHILGIARRQVHRLDRMLGDLTDATRIESGNLEIRPGRMDLRGVAATTRDLFSGVDGADRIRLDLPPESVPVFGDELRLEQVTTNLVSNALKYSPSGGDVEVAVRAEGNEAVLRVRDHGVGIPQSELESIFEPFRRGETLRGHVPGVGLGLSVARKIVVAHGGRLQVTSEAGRGSTFEVRLPLRADDRLSVH